MLTELKKTLSYFYPYLVMRLMVGSTLFWVVGCAPKSKDPVVQSKQGTLSSSEAQANSVPFKLGVLNPYIQNPSPSTMFMGPKGQSVQLKIFLQTKDPKDFSFAVETKHKNIIIKDQTIVFQKLEEGDFGVTLVARSLRACKAVFPNGQNFCVLSNPYFQGELQSFDTKTKFLITGIDPKVATSDPNKNCTGGSGDFTQKIVCKQGILGALAGAFMPALGGGMNNNGSNNSYNNGGVGP